MAEKKFTLSLEQLNEIVSDAVTTAIKKLENIEVTEEKSSETQSGNTRTSIRTKLFFNGWRVQRRTVS